MNLLTNNPMRTISLRWYGIEVLDQVPLSTPPNAQNAKYLRTKRDKLGHTIEDVDEGRAG